MFTFILYNVADSETSDMVPCIEEAHPAGITLTRVGYYTIPPMDELAVLVENGHCIVENFTVGRYNYGNVFFPESFDVAGLNLDEIGMYEIECLSSVHVFSVYFWSV